MKTGDEPSRRAFLSLATGALAATATGVAPCRLVAQAAAHSFKVGAAEVTVISDGAMVQPVELMLPGREQGQIEAAFKQAGQSFSGFNAEINVAIVRIGSEVILVDAGGGPDFMPTLGKLNERMTAAGVAPETITKVIFTHAHPDHFWGVIDPLGGGTLYEKAAHVMSAAERDYWLKPDVATRAPDAFRGMAAGTHRRLQSMAERMGTVVPGTEIVPGVEIVDTAGHTPGHVSVLVKSGAEQVLIGGDALTQHVISFAEPGWQWGPDMDSDRAVATRKRLLDRLVADRIPLLGYHLPWPGLGRIERKGAAYRYVPA